MGCKIMKGRNRTGCSDPRKASELPLILHDKRVRRKPECLLRIGGDRLNIRSALIVPVVVWNHSLAPKTAWGARCPHT